MAFSVFETTIKSKVSVHTGNYVFKTVMANHYRNFLRLLEKWPVDQTKKKNRDLSLFIREQLKINFSGGAVDNNVDEEKCTRQYESLKRISSNYYGKKYLRRSQASATGLTAEQCNSILSDEFLDYLQEKEKSFFSKVFNSKDSK